MSRHLKQALLLRTTLLKTLNADKEKLYCQLLDLWLRKRCTRDEFDWNVKKFLSETGMKLHIKFLNNVSKLSSGLMALPLLNNSGLVRTFTDINNIILYKFIDKTIPCPVICLARFFVNAWASGIISVNSDLGKLLHKALRNFLKDIIFALVSVKNSYKVRANNFKHIEAITNIKLPSGFYRNTRISSIHLILVLQRNPSILKMGLSKYIELVINGPLS